MAFPIVSVEHTPANEGSDGTFVVRLDQPATEAIQLHYRVLTGSGAGSLEAGAFGYGLETGEIYTVTINPGETSVTINVRTDSDNIDKPDLSYSLELFDLQGAQFANGSTYLRATGIALDNDGAPGAAIVVGAPIIVEGDSGTQVVRFEVQLSRPLSSNATVQYTTLDGSATAGSDYVAKSGSLTFVAGQTSAFVDVVVKGDTVREGAETFSLKITPPAAAPSTAGTIGTATILNDDTVNDLPSVSVEHMAAEEGEYGTFIVRLDKPATEAIQLHYRAVTGSGAGSLEAGAFGYGLEAGEIYTLTINPGESTATITIRTDSDNVDKSDLSYSLELFDLQGAEFAGGGSYIRTTGIALDNDGGTSTAVAVGAPIVVEGDSGSQTVRFEIKLSRPLNTSTTIDYTTLDGSATAGSDYVAKSGTVTFAAGQTSAFVDVVVKGDAVREGAETFSLKITPPASAPSTAGSIGTATILNDDTLNDLPSVSVEHTAAEEGEYGTFIVRLDRPATEAVQLNYRVVTGSGTGSLETGAFGYGLESGEIYRLTINPGETTATITIRTDSDNIDKTDLSYSLELFELQGAEFAGGGSIVRTTGIALDNDGGTNTVIAVGAPIVVEGDSGSQTVRFEIKLSRPLNTSTTVDYATLDGSAIAGSDYVAKSGTVTFAAGQTSAFVDVVVKGDTAGEAAETFSLMVTPPTTAPSPLSVVGTATILNDDTKNDLPSLSVDHVAAEEGEDGVFIIRLDKPATEAIQFKYRAVTGSGAGTLEAGALGFGLESGQSYSVTINPGETTATITIRTDSDNIDKTDLSYSLELFDLQGAAFAGGGPSVRVIGIALDDDSTANNRVAVGQQLVQFDGAANKDTVTFEIKLSRPAATDTVINYNTLDGTALAGQNYIAKSGSVTIEAGATSAFVTVRLLDSAANDAGKTFTLSVKPALFGSANQIGAIIQPHNAYGTDAGEILTGTDIDDVIFGLGGNDTISGLAGRDYLSGGAGNDTLSGGIGNDTLLGGAGRDTLLGGSGGDILSGGDGADILRGSTGRDQLTGGAGADRFVFAAGESVGVPGVTNDRIRDFKASEGDKIDLALIDARTNLAGDQTFAFIGTAGFGKVAGELRFEAISGNTFVSGDVDGDGIADFAIRLDGIVQLVATDFVL